MPKVSVIVPSYNHAEYLIQRIESVLGQSFQDFELILLDDSSTDGSWDILHAYKDHEKVSHLVLNKANSGSTFKQWNKGIQLAKGEYIWIAESDDWADKFFLEKLVGELDKRPYVGLVYATSKLVDSYGEVMYENNSSQKITEYKGFDFIRERLSLHNTIWNASMMIFRKTLYPDEEKQKLYSDMKYCGDWLFYILMAKQADIVKICEDLNFFRIHNENVSSNAEKEGLTFIEGLIVYSYIKEHIRGVNKLKLGYAWVKKYNRYKYRFNYSQDVKKRILKLFVSKHLILYIFNIPVSLYYYIKKKNNRKNA